MEAAALMPTNMKLYIQLARQLVERAAHAASEEENEVVIGIIRHAQGSARYYSTVATGFWYDWLRQVLRSVAVTLVTVTLPAPWAGTEDSRGLGLAHEDGGWTRRLRLLRVLHALTRCLPASDIDAALVRGDRAAQEMEVEVGEMEAASAGSSAADGGHGCSGGQLVGALAGLVLEAVHPCNQWQAQSVADGAADDASAAGMLAIQCLHILAGSSSGGSQTEWVGWGTAFDTGVGVAAQAEDALLKGVLMGSSLGHSGFMWHYAQTAVLNLAAARPHAARRRYGDAVACAVRETLPSDMSAYARLSSLLLRIQALS